MAEESVAPAVVYEPLSPPPPDMEIVPNTEIIPGLRMHFHRGGVSFGLIAPEAPEFSAVLTYEKARALMLCAAMMEQRSEDGAEEHPQSVHVPPRQIRCPACGAWRNATEPCCLVVTCPARTPAQEVDRVG